MHTDKNLQINYITLLVHHILKSCQQVLLIGNVTLFYVGRSKEFLGLILPCGEGNIFILP